MILKKIKSAFYKIMHVDKNRSRFLAMLGIILAFVVFMGISYSEFIVEEEENAINIRVADLSYSLTNDSVKDSSKIEVEANKIKVVTFSLTSKNSIPTKYALNYNASSKNIEVFYSHNERNNMSGIIGTDGATITLRVVIVNNSTNKENVTFDINGGYASQEDLSSNIVEGYYEEPLVKRIILLDENYDNAKEAVSNQELNSDYLYFDTVCTEDANITWDIYKNDIDIDTKSPNIACDIYFKKAVKQDIELVYRVIDPSKLIIIKEGSIDYSKYRYSSAHCNNDAIIEFDEDKLEVTIKNVTSRTLCVVNLDLQK